MIIAPTFGEGLSGSTPLLDLLLPWNLAFMSALYGCGALLCRELAHRCGLGFTGFCFLGAAYGVWEEALVDRYWFFPTFWRDSGVGDYSVVWHTNVLLAVHLTVFHIVVSICSSVLVVEWLTPRRRSRTWTTRPGLAAAAVTLACTPVVYGEFNRRPPAAVLAASALVLVVLVIAAFVVGYRCPDVDHTAPRPPPRGLSTIAFVTVLLHWVATYGIAETTVPWPFGVAIALSPVIIGGALIARLAATGPYGPDGIRVVAGVLFFFALLDTFVGLGGRYDLTASGLVVGLAARKLSHGRRSPKKTQHGIVPG